MSGSPLISCKGLSLGYKGGPEVIHSVDLEVRQGDFLAILGPNGCGKTTLLLAMLGLLSPREGQITWFGPQGDGTNDPLIVRPGYVPQRHSLSALYPFTAYEVVLMGRFGRMGPVRRPSANDRDAAHQALDEAGLADLANHPFRDLSGGQKQRTLLARALCSEPSLLILDEPTNDLDLAGEAAVMGLVLDLQRAGRCTVVFVSHLMHVVAAYARRVAIMADGQLEVGDASHMLTPEHLTRLYGTKVLVTALEDGRPVVAHESGRFAKMRLGDDSEPEMEKGKGGNQR